VLCSRGERHNSGCEKCVGGRCIAPQPLPLSLNRSVLVCSKQVNNVPSGCLQICSA